MESISFQAPTGLVCSVDSAWVVGTVKRPTSKTKDLPTDQWVYWFAIDVAPERDAEAVRVFCNEQEAEKAYAALHEASGPVQSDGLTVALGKSGANLVDLGL